MGAGGVPQVVEQLPSKYKALNQTLVLPHHTEKKKGGGGRRLGVGLKPQPVVYLPCK
jgi:hypothetical protein